MRLSVAVLCAALLSTTAGAAQPVVEFYNALLNHYFITIDPAEAAGIDAGTAGPGWHRTARVFGAYVELAAAPPDAMPVCRFYGEVAAGGSNSHFFTADPAECAAVKLDPGWRFEGIAFYIRIPVGGTCAGGSVPVRRNYNRRFAQRDSNHRYATDPALYDEMTAIGWAAEGVVFCGDPAISTPPRAPAVASGLSPLAPGCDGSVPTSLGYPNAEVEPFIAANPRAPDNLIGVWQQDRWFNGGARAVIAAASFDGGRSWEKSAATFARCTGGNVGNGGDYARATDPWLTFAPDGTAWQIAIAFSGAALSPGSRNAVRVSRSRDGGASWESPITLKSDDSAFFNDKESLVADPVDSRFAYAIWDRLDQQDQTGTWFTRTTDGGDTWEAAREIYHPGPYKSTLNHQIAVLPDGTLVDFFSESTYPADGTPPTVSLVARRSLDRGETWSDPITIADTHATGVRDPETGQELRDGAGLGQIAADRQGRLFAVWQDTRSGQGSGDAVFITRSDDRGQTWSAPVRVNPDRGVPAFEPALAVARDGTIGVAYFDLRSNTPDPTTLLADYWLARSSDGVDWSEVHVDGAFDYAVAPDAGGLFLGDYQGLATVGNAFLSFFARPNAGQPGNPTDIIATFVAPR